MSSLHIPPVNEFLDKVKAEPEFAGIDRYMLKRYVRAYIQKIKGSLAITDRSAVLEQFMIELREVFISPLKPIINATGIVLHTNLGRSPYSEKIYQSLQDNCLTYTNIELDLNTGKRAYRDDYLKPIFNFITGSEDVVIVNNNAAALYLILKKYAQRKEVIISRGELIEIGGSFRIPDILKDAGAKLIEVGTTNCTRISDYEKAITEKTAIIFKAHTSNYAITGHTESATLDELVALARKHSIPFVYDAGSGLIKKPRLLCDGDGDITATEPDISQCIEKGVDIVCFSGDKLLGGVQAGIILGTEKYLKPLKKHPLMRVLRADKYTISSLYHYVSMFKDEDELMKHNKVFAMLSQTEKQLSDKANALSNALQSKDIPHKVINSTAQIGGGSLPELKLPSFQIQLVLPKSISAEVLFHKLLKADKPILSILKERKLAFDVFTINETDFPHIVKSIKE